MEFGEKHVNAFVKGHNLCIIEVPVNRSQRGLWGRNFTARSATPRRFVRSTMMTTLSR